MAGAPLPRSDFFNELTTALSRQCEALDALKQKLENQKEQLIRFQVDDLEQSNAEIAELTARVATLEKDRYVFVARKFGRSEMKLSEIVDVAPVEHGARLREIHARLRSLSRAVGRLSTANADLMRNGAGLVEGMLNLYRHSLNARPVYERERIVDTVGLQGSMVSTRL
ncbi:MAG: flagellar protein FlgN [Nitrospirae bacterium]|nr:flagellar protein FlgN [Nitrospirota bacterium]